MKNEMDKTVAEILALPDNEIASWYMSTVNCPDDMEAVDLKALATSYERRGEMLTALCDSVQKYADAGEDNITAALELFALIREAREI